MIPKSFKKVTPFTRFLALMMLIIFPIVGFLLGRVYQLNTQTIVQTSTSDKTVGWNTYTNINYKYSIKYPSELTDLLDEQASSIITLSFLASRYVPENPTPFGQLVFSVETSDININDYVEKYKTTDNNSIPVTVSNVNSLQTVLWSGSFDNGPTIYQSFNKNGKIYNIGVVAPQNGNQQAILLLNQILSTFKFTN